MYFCLICNSRCSILHSPLTTLPLSLRNIVARYKTKYAEARREEKAVIADEIVSVIASGENGRRARFLKRQDESVTDSPWVEVSNLVARDKVSHALRCKPKASGAKKQLRSDADRGEEGDNEPLLKSLSNGRDKTTPASRTTEAGPKKKKAKRKKEEVASLPPSHPPVSLPSSNPLLSSNIGAAANMANRQESGDLLSSARMNTTTPGMAFAAATSSSSTLEEQRNQALLMMLIQEEERRIYLQRQQQQMGLGMMPPSMYETMYASAAQGSGPLDTAALLQRQLLLSSASAHNSSLASPFLAGNNTVSGITPNTSLGGLYNPNLHSSAFPTQVQLPHLNPSIIPTAPSSLAQTEKVSSEEKAARKHSISPVDESTPEKGDVAALLTAHLDAKRGKKVEEV